MFKSPLIHWCLFVFLSSITALWCAVDVKPYREMKRDLVFGLAVLGGLALLFLFLAVRATIRKGGK